MKQVMFILTIIAVVFYIRYVNEVENYKNTEEKISQLETNKMCEIDKKLLM